MPTEPPAPQQPAVQKEPAESPMQVDALPVEVPELQQAFDETVDRDKTAPVPRNDLGPKPLLLEPSVPALPLRKHRGQSQPELPSLSRAKAAVPVAKTEPVAKAEPPVPVATAEPAEPVASKQPQEQVAKTAEPAEPVASKQPQEQVAKTPAAVTVQEAKVEVPKVEPAVSGAVATPAAAKTAEAPKQQTMSEAQKPEAKARPGSVPQSFASPVPDDSNAKNKPEPPPLPASVQQASLSFKQPPPGFVLPPPPKKPQVKAPPCDSAQQPPVQPAPVQPAPVQPAPAQPAPAMPAPVGVTGGVPGVGDDKDKVMHLSCSLADHDLFWGKKGDKRKSRQWEEYDELWMEDEEAEESWPWWSKPWEHDDDQGAPAQASAQGAADDLDGLPAAFRSGRWQKRRQEQQQEEWDDGKWDKPEDWYQPKDQGNQWYQWPQSNAQSTDQSNDAQGQWRQSQDDQSNDAQGQWRQSNGNDAQGQWWRQSQDQSQGNQQGEWDNQGQWWGNQWIRSDSQNQNTQDQPMMYNDGTNQWNEPVVQWAWGNWNDYPNFLNPQQQASDGQQWWGGWSWQ
eukprot:s3211_g4.t1